MICPQALPEELVEILGTIDIDAPPEGSPANTPGKLRRAPIGVKVPDDVVGKLGPGVWYVYRKTTYTFAGTAAKCLGPVKYDVCEYFQDIQIYVQGSINVGAIILNEYRGAALKDGDWTVSGVCWEGVIGITEKVGTSFIPTPKHLSLKTSSGHSLIDSPNAAMLAALKGSDHEENTNESAVLVTPRISRSAFDIIARSLAAVTGRQFVSLELPSLRSGSAALNDIAHDLDALQLPEVAELHNVFVRLGNARIRTREGATADSIWVSEASLLMKKRER